MFALTAMAFADEKIDPAKLVGKWEDKNAGNGDTSSMEFTKDGSVKVINKGAKGKDILLEGTYKVDGDKLTMKVHPGNKKKSTDRVVTIEKLSDQEFVQTDDSKATKSFARVKATSTTAEAPKAETTKTEAPVPAELPTDPLPKGKLPAADFKLVAADYRNEFKKDAKAAQEKYKGKIVHSVGT
jgi:uncharacterized protein (TIGR03066 family)